MSTPVTLRITLPRIPDIELVALEGLQRLARHLGIAEDKIGEARIIVTEAIINALEHANADPPVVHVEFSMTSEALSIFVRDEGKGFDPSTVLHQDNRQELRPGRKRGWGLRLMESLSDDFRIESNRNGTTITILKHLS